MVSLRYPHRHEEVGTYFLNSEYLNGSLAGTSSFLTLSAKYFLFLFLVCNTGVDRTLPDAHEGAF